MAVCGAHRVISRLRRDRVSGSGFASRSRRYWGNTNMSSLLSVAALDVRRIVTSRGTAVLLVIALTIMGYQTVTAAHTIGYAVSPSLMDTSGFQAFVEPTPPHFSGGEVLAHEASPSVRFATSLWYLDYLALAALVVFGGFFARDTQAGYDLVRRSRGLSAGSLFAANVLSVIAVSFSFSVIGVLALYLVCLAVNPQSMNSLAQGQMMLEQVLFLPQFAASRPLLYAGFFVLIYTGILSFLGVLGLLIARLTRSVVIAAVAPAGFLYVLGGFVAARLPGVFVVFAYDNLSIATRSITSMSVMRQYVAPYFMWIVVLVALGLSLPLISPGVRRLWLWPSR